MDNFICPKCNQETQIADTDLYAICKCGKISPICGQTPIADKLGITQKGNGTIRLMIKE